MSVDAFVTVAMDQGQNVVGRPAGDESAQNERNGTQGFTGSVLRLGLLTLFAALIFLFSAPFNALTDGAYQIGPITLGR